MNEIKEEGTRLRDPLTPFTGQVMQRMKQIHEQRGLSLRETTNEIINAGFKVGYAPMVNIIYGRRENVTIEEVAGFATTFNINIEWLITGEGRICLDCQDHIWGNLTCNSCGHSGPDKMPEWDQS